MIENESAQDVVEEPIDIVATQDDDGNDTTDYKALAEKNLGIAKRNATRLKKSKEVKEAAAPVAEKKEEKVEKKGFDYAELAWLEVKGISDEEELKYVESLVKETGKNLRELFATSWFQKDLKEKREEKASKDAIPSGSKRSAASSKDSVEFWLTKGTLPEDTPENRELRQKVVNAKIKSKESGDMFTKNPVVK